ncbi:MAG: DUF2993 domain-containing protein [Chthonomonadales bacterium]
MPRRLNNSQWIIVGCVTALCLMPGCSRTINRSAERRIRDTLPEYIGQASDWKAHVDNPAGRTLRGHLKTVTIDGTQVHLKQTIVCDTLHIEMKDVDVDTGGHRLKSVGSTLFAATISEKSLNDYVRDTPPPPDEPVHVKKIVLRAGVMHVEGTRWILGKAWPYTMNVEPRIANSKKVEFDPDKMTAIGVTLPIPASALRWFARRMSEGLEMSTLPFPVELRTFLVTPGRLMLIGTADVMQSLNQQMSTVWPKDKR